LDGDLDLALTGAAPDGMHHLFRNQLSSQRAGRSLQVMVLNERGNYTRPGAEVRLFRAGKLLGTNILDTGSGYNSQNAMPVHFGLSENKPVDVEVTTLTKYGRKTVSLSNVSPEEYTGRILTVKVNAAGEIVK